MFKLFIALLLASVTQKSFSENQTPELSPIYSPESLPFEVSVELADFSLPEGLQSFDFAVHKDKCLLLAGNNRGLRYFAEGIGQNTTAFVIDLSRQIVYQRSLYDPTAHLNKQEIDALSLVGSAYVQAGDTLYIAGGYIVDESMEQFTTLPTLTAVDVPEFINWVINPSKTKTANKYVRQTSDPILQVGGGSLFQANKHTPFQLIFGQDYEAPISETVNGVYSQQVRLFKVIDNGKKLTVFAQEYKPQDPSYRRANGNIAPIIQADGKNYKEAFIALSGVFTPTRGIWTVPVFISIYGDTFMPNPSQSDTLKQGMNNYSCPHLGLFSKKSGQMNILLFGGLSYETYTNGTFSLDAKVPFTNNITNISINKEGLMAQYLMDTEYPVVLSTFIDPPSPLFFGTSARFIPLPNIPIFSNEVISLDSLNGPTLVGYIVGGIQSISANTTAETHKTHTTSSPYIFKVIIRPKS